MSISRATSASSPIRESGTMPISLWSHRFCRKPVPTFRHDTPNLLDFQGGGFVDSPLDAVPKSPAGQAAYSRHNSKTFLITRCSVKMAYLGRRRPSTGNKRVIAGVVAQAQRWAVDFAGAL